MEIHLERYRESCEKYMLAHSNGFEMSHNLFTVELQGLPLAMGDRCKKISGGSFVAEIVMLATYKRTLEYLRCAS